MTEKSWADCQVVKRPKDQADMTLMQRVGDWKEWHFIGRFTESLIDDLALRVIELENEIAKRDRYNEKLAEAAGL